MKLFKQNLQKCKINKLHEVNFKIIHRILVTLALISRVRKYPKLAEYWWYGGLANIDHILIECPQIILLLDFVKSKIDLPLTLRDRVFGILGTDALVIWLVNFTIYKAHLMAVEGLSPDMLWVLCETVKLYYHNFDCVQNLMFLRYLTHAPYVLLALVLSGSTLVFFRME